MVESRKQKNPGGESEFKTYMAENKSRKEEKKLQENVRNSKRD